MTTWKRKRTLALAFRGFSVGDIVVLAGNPSYKGKVEAYLGYQITHKAKGRTYKIAWIVPAKKFSIHFDFELKKVKSKLTLKTRPKKGK